MPNDVTILAAVRAAKVLERAKSIMQAMSQEDLYTLQHDVLSRPTGTRIPANLKETFFEWLSDSYGEYERETKMALENQAEIETAFLEEAVDSDDPALAAQAQFILDGGRLADVSHNQEADGPTAG